MARKSPMRCCKARDARHCMCLWAKMHPSAHSWLPRIYVPHYEEHCDCFSCRWVRETEHSFVLSRIPNDPFPYPVANPTHDRVPKTQRKDLLTRVPKHNFQIMYIYAITLKDESWHWVVVLPKPLIPFLLTDKKYSEVTRFARHPTTGWFGLTDNGQVINMPQTMKPPLYNPLYQEFGYHPDSSPYIVQQQCPQDHACEHQGNPPAQNKDQSSCEVLSDWPPLNERRPWVVQPHCANPQLPSESTVSYTHSCSVHNGQYYGKRRSNQYTDWHNTTIFVGGLRKKMTDDQLRFWFEGFGELMYVNKKKEEEVGENGENGVQERQGEEGGQEGDEGYTCGFVQFADRKVAEMAMAQMQGFPINGNRLRLSWGRRYIFTDEKSQEVYKLAVKQAYKGYLAFSERIRRGEPRLPGDPEFWQEPDAKLMEYDDPDLNEGD